MTDHVFTDTPGGEITPHAFHLFDVQQAAGDVGEPSEQPVTSLCGIAEMYGPWVEEEPEGLCGNCKRIVQKERHLP